MKRINKGLLGISLLLTVGIGGCNEESTDYPVQPVNFTDVQINDNFWTPKIKINREVSIPTAFHQCEINGRVDNFAIAAGLIEGEHKGDFPFDDTDIYKVVEGASYVLATQYDPKLDHYLDSIIAIVAGAQESDGYLFTCRTNDCKHLHRWMGDERWERINSHELYNCGHLYEAAVAHFYATGKRSLLDVAIKNADLVCEVFGPKDNQIHWPSGHPIAEMGLVKMYRVTGNEKYLETAKYFVDEAGRLTDGRKPNEYSQDHKPIREQEEALGHAVRFGYLYSGVADVAALCKDETLVEASKRLWDNIADKKLYITGGIGARAWGEGFGDNYELPNMTAYCETCASISNVYWNYRMFLLTGESKYYDVLERALYNGVISGVSLDGIRYFYDNPLMSDGAHDRSEWFGCSCCPSNVTRFMASIPGYVYAVKNNTVYVNLYTSNTGTIDVNGEKVTISQKTEYPWEGNIEINMGKSNNDISLAVRIPGWAVGQPLPGELYTFVDSIDSGYEIKLNGETIKPIVKDGYAIIDIPAETENSVLLNLPMKVQKVLTDSRVIDNNDKCALLYGPIVYCIEGVDHDGYALDIFIDKNSDFIPIYKPGFLDGVMTLSGKGKHLMNNLSVSKDITLTAIPYYAWNNRGPNEMNVWLPYKKEAAIPRRVETLASRAKSTVSVPYEEHGLNDRLEPRNSADKSYMFHNWWMKFGTEEWAQYEWETPVTLSESEVYWLEHYHYDIDFQLPAHYKLEYRSGDKWLPVQNLDAYTVEKDKYNKVRFKPVKTDALRLTAQLKEGKSAGILEWKVN